MKISLRGAVSAVDDFFFAPSSPVNLAGARCLFYLGVLLATADEDFSRWPSAVPSLWNPTGLFKLLHVPLFSESTVGILQIVWRVSMVACALGLATRLSQVVAGGLGTYLMGLTASFGSPNSKYDSLVLILLAMMFARSGDALSLDRLIVSKLRAPTPVPEPHGRYRWPKQWALIVLSIVFGMAGFNKILVNFAFSDSLRMYLLLAPYANYYWSDALLSHYLPAFAQSGIPIRPIAIETVVFEFCYPLALFFRWPRYVLITLGVGFIFLNYLAMVPPFALVLAACHVWWIPYDRVLQALRLRTRPALAPLPS